MHRGISGGRKYRGLTKKGKFLVGSAAIVALTGVAGCDGVPDQSSNHSQYKTDKVANEGLTKEPRQRVEKLEAKVEGQGAADSQYTADRSTWGGQSDQQQAEVDARAAAESYYRAVSEGDWSYTYDNLDSETRSRYTQEEWFAKNQWFASNGSVTFDVLSVDLVGTSPKPFANVTVGLGYGDGTSSTRLTYFVYESGSWKHRFGEEENTLYMADASYDEFVAAQGGTSSASASPSEPSSTSASASAAPKGSGTDRGATVTVSRVVDGDTIEISPAVNGNDEVRLIGVDTPETKDPSEGIEPYGPKASAFATDELIGQRVGLEFDQEREDRYGRLLAYVYVGGEMFNEVLLEEGYAQAYPYEPNTKYEERFASAQTDARAAGLGIWGLSHAQQCELADRANGIGEGSAGCEIAADEPTSASSSASATATPTATAEPSGGGVPPISEEDCPPSAPIKGNESSSGELIYHTWSSATYDETHPEECFATEAAAQAAGYRAARD